MIATRGNALCMDWGIPADLGLSGNRDSDEVLVARWDHSYYLYESARERHREILGAGFGTGEPFAALIRNGHLLRPVSHKLPALPEGHMEKIYAGAQGTLFTSKQLREARWIAWWTMYFASDGMRTSYHRWQSCHYLQRTLLKRWDRVRRWLASSWTELFGDAVAMVLAGALRTGILWAVLSQSWTPSAIDFLVWGPLATTASFFAMEFASWYRDPIGRSEPNDRPTPFEQFEAFVLVAIESPFLLRPLLMLPKLAAWYCILFVFVACLYYSSVSYRMQERAAASSVTRRTIDVVCLCMAVYAAQKHPWLATSVVDVMPGMEMRVTW